MAISRMQMNRELYAGGGILSLTPRSKFGLGSKLKKFVRNIIPNEISSIAVKAAPFVAPFNPTLAGYMSAIGTFDQTGRIGQSVKAGLINYGLGQAGRYIGGAGFQQGINPFAGANFSGGIMSGLGSLFTSPIGTQTGLQLGQYKMFGGPGSEAFKAGQDIANVGQANVGQANVGASLDEIVGPGGDIESFLYKTDPSKLTSSQLSKQIALDANKTLLERSTGTGYTDLFSKLISPDSTLAQRTQALKDLGGKALTTIYTNKDGSIDKLAVGATIAGATNYIEARKLAKEAGLVDDEDQYTEEMYEADKARYAEKYSQILTPEAFGIKAADGGIISLRKMKQSGSVPEEFISYTDDNSGVIYYDPEGNPITKAEAMKAFDEMPEEDQIITDMEGKPLGEPKTRKRILPMPKPKEMVFEGRMKRLMEAKGMLEPESFEYLLQELKDEMTESGIPSIKLEKKATGGRVGLKDGPGKDGLQNFKVGEYKPFKYTGSIDDVWEADLGGDPLGDIVKIGYTVRAPLIDIIRGVAKTGKEAASLIAAATKAGYDLTKPVRETIGDVAGGIYDVAKKTVQESGDASRFIQPLYYLERFAPEKNLTDDETRLRRLKRSIGRDDRDLIKTIENRIFGYDDAGINQSEEDKKVSKQIQADIDSRDFGFKKGGRIQYAMGSEVPIRQNEAGTKEMDFRQSGGFVPPIGIKEKADDIPAMLSNNEFVFTADAVRAAGGGSVNKGAQKMYALMKQLEGKVV